MSESQTVVVSGATGFIGTAVMKRLHQTGWRTIVVSTDPAGAREKFQFAADWIGYGGDALERALATHGRAIRLAGQSPLTHRWTRKYKVRIWESRVGTAGRIAASLARSKAADRVLISAGGINIHPDLGDAPVTESSPFGNEWVARMLQAKEAALEPARRSGVRTATMRIGIAFGKGGGPLAFMEQPFRKGIGGHIGSGRQYVPWLHIDDLAEMFVTALDRPDWEGPFIAAAPEPVRARDLARLVGGHLDKRSWLHMPAPVARIALGEVATLVLSSYRADPAKAMKLGFRFRYPTIEAALGEVYAADPEGQPVPSLTMIA